MAELTTETNSNKPTIAIHILRNSDLNQTTFTEAINSYKTEVENNTVSFVLNPGATKFAIIVRYGDADGFIFFNSDDLFTLTGGKDLTTKVGFTGLFSEDNYDILNNLNKKLDINSATSEVAKNTEIIESILYEDGNNSDITKKHYNLNENILTNFNTVLTDIKNLQNDIKNVSDYLLFDNEDQEPTLQDYIETKIKGTIDKILSAYINHLHSDIMTGDPGEDGRSPTIKENNDNDEDTYKLDITYYDDETEEEKSFTTPNLKPPTPTIEEEYDAGKTVHDETITIDGTTYTVGEHAEIFNIYEGEYKNVAIGDYSHAEGYKNVAIGDYSHAEGRSNIISGIESHVEGSNNNLSGNYNHIEGEENKTSNNCSHTHIEGYKNISTDTYCSHLEGSNNSTKSYQTHVEGVGNNIDTTIANYSHLEGRGNSLLNYCYGSHIEGENNKSYTCYVHMEGYQNTIGEPDSDMGGSYSHVEGIGNFIHYGEYAHAEGRNNEASGNAAHVEGSDNKATNTYAHAEGVRTVSSAVASHAEGNETQATNSASHAEGCQTIASGNYSHAEGCQTEASSSESHAEGYRTIASGNFSHAENSGGNDGVTLASGDYSHAEGRKTTASGEASHVEGRVSIASGEVSHAEGNNCKAEGTFSHAEGISSVASGYACHSEGSDTKAIGNQSHAEGHGNITFGNYSHAEGYMNIINTLNGTEAFNNYYGHASHVEGQHNKVFGSQSHAEGQYNENYGEHSHVEGGSNILGYLKNNNSIVMPQYSHIEGNVNKLYTNGTCNHIEGERNIIGDKNNPGNDSGNYIHLEGSYNEATGGSHNAHIEGYGSIINNSYCAHAEGYQCKVNNSSQSHVEGFGCRIDNGGYSHVGGNGCISNVYEGFVHGNYLATYNRRNDNDETDISTNHRISRGAAFFGKYNRFDFENLLPNGVEAIFSIGIGYSTNSRRTALVVGTDGKIYDCSSQAAAYAYYNRQEIDTLFENMQTTIRDMSEAIVAQQSLISELNTRVTELESRL